MKSQTRQYIFIHSHQNHLKIMFLENNEGLRKGAFAPWYQLIILSPCRAIYNHQYYQYCYSYIR